MEDKEHFIEPLFDRAEDYAKTSYELFRLKTIDKSMSVFSMLILKLILASVFLMFLLFGSVGVSFWLGDRMGEMYHGFFCVAGFYAFILCVISFFMSDWLKERVNNWIITKLNN